MPNPTSFSLPHLKPDELADRDREENVLGRKLSSCWRGDELDVERAYQIMRGAVELIFEVMYKAFRKNAGYTAEWLPVIAKDAVYRTLKISLGYISNGLPSSTNLNELGGVLEATVQARVKELETPVRLEAPTAISKSPLLIMMAESMTRRAQSSVLVSARPPRVPRSIQSMSAVEKMERYREQMGLGQTEFAGRLGVDPKTLYKFRRTGKIDKKIAAVIANAIGITVEELIGNLSKDAKNPKTSR
jgi:DNA-binding XRE family transcriptional regulator